MAGGIGPPVGRRTTRTRLLEFRRRKAESARYVLRLANISRWQAGGGHLLLSVAIGATVLTTMILVWYPPPFFEAAGGFGLVLLLFGVDVTLGPLLTTAVYNPAKGLGKLKFDLVVIGVLQLAALAYGIHVMYSARPAYLVFAVDRFDLVMANTLPATELAKAPPPWNRVPVGRPPTVGARVPDDPQLKEESLFLALGGVDLTQQPRFFVPYAEIASDAARKGREIAELKRGNPDRTEAIDAIVRASGRAESGLRYLAARAPSRDFAVIIDATDGAIIDMTIARPW